MSWVAVGVGAAGVIAGGASAATAQGPTVYGPEEMTRKNIAAWGIYGPGVLGLNKVYNPAYADLGNQVARDTLFGTQARTENRIIPVWRDGEYTFHKQKFKMPGQEGLLSLHKRAGADMAQFNREQMLTDLNTFAPAALQAYKQANPLLSNLTQRAQDGLDQGGALDPSTVRTLTQAAFGNASLRGFGHSPLDAYQAYSNMGMEAEARKRQREGFAAQVAGMQPDPFALMGRPSLAATYGPALGMQGAAWGRQTSMPAINPFAANGVTSVPQDNTTSNMLGAISGGLFSMAGGMGGMGGGRQAPPNTGYGYQPQSYVNPRY